jgi:excisionase family DNA binding protein
LARNTSKRTGVVFLVFSAHHAVMGAGDLIRTGEAARILGCSRQHVVDLCNDGRLSVARQGGSHRFVRRSDVLALTKRPLTRDQEQSRWLHGAIVSHLVTDPDRVLSQARGNLDRFVTIHEGTMAEHWLDEWRATLDAGPDRVLSVLMSDAPHASELRQNSPFAGILSAAERRKVLESFRSHWRAEHAL